MKTPAFRVRCLASGSKGNAYLFYSDREAILVDAGIRLRAFSHAWEEMGLQKHRLLGIALTHEHSDHILCAELLARKWNCPILGTKGTLSYSWKRPEILESVVVESGTPIKLGEWELLPVETHHDAEEPVFYKLSCAGASACVLTDTGYFDGEWREILESCSLVFLESNYEDSLLEAGPYPYLLQERIRGPYGHLSNLDAFEVIQFLGQTACQHVALVHLSEKTNRPDMALLRPLRWLQSQETALTISCLPPQGLLESYEVYAR